MAIKLLLPVGVDGVLTNDANVAKLAKHLSTTAKHSHPWKYEHDQIATIIGCQISTQRWGCTVEQPEK